MEESMRLSGFVGRTFSQFSTQFSRSADGGKLSHAQVRFS